MRLFKYFSISAIFLILFFGGLGVEKEFVQVAGVIIVLILTGMFYLLTGELKFPKNFKVYLLFLGVLLISLFWSIEWQKSFEYFVLFLGGGVFWLYSFNFSKHLKTLFTKLVIGLGLIFAVLFFLNYAGSETSVSSWSLHLAYTTLGDHFHIGDYWAIAVVLASIGYIKTKSKHYLAFVIVGIYLLILSLSRSAYAAAAAGLAIIFSKKLSKVKNKHMILGLLIVIAALFIYSGSLKPTLINRQYYVQALVGIVNNPLGVGMGNFATISNNPENWVFGLSGFSSMVHNIALEVLVGVGVFGLIFVYWLYKVSKEVWERKNGDILYIAVFFTLLVNFLFDSTYFIPAMLWLWFVSLGLSQAKN